MADGAWRRLGRAVTAFRRTLAGDCIVPDCIGSDRLAGLLSSAPVVLYAMRWTPDFTPTFVSANLKQFCGIAADDLLNNPGLWTAAIHPDDRDRRQLALASLGERGRVTLDYRMRHAEGGWRWVRDEARLAPDSHGQPAEVVGSWLDITGRHESEEALAASEAQLRTAQSLLTDALESSGDAFSLYDAEDRLLVFNSRYTEFYSTIADVIRPGVKFEDLIRVSAQRSQYAGISPTRVEEWVRERMLRHRAASGVFEQQLSDGRCLEIVERPTIGGGRVAIRRDVTARKRIEEALRRELAFKQTLIDALPFPVFFKGRDGRYLGCNTKFCEALGRPAGEIVNRTVFELMPAHKAEEYARSDRELFDNPGIQIYETTMQWGDGSIRRLSVVKGTYMDSEGAVSGFIGSLIDLTEQKRAEEQLVQAAKLATLGQIASEVAHELNQPLSIIRMSAESCLQAAGALDHDRLDRKLSTIVGQVRRMAEIVDHLRSFSRLESGAKIPFAPGPVVTAAARLLTPHFQLDGIALETDVDESSPEICGQPNQLEQVILNLLANARDAVRDKCPTGKGRVELRLWCESDWVYLSLRDNGGGIPDAMWPLVFDPFFTTKADGTGTGLGLSISANIIAGMGGRISGHNVDDGAFFVITLPRHHPAPPSAAEAEPEIPVQAEAEAKPAAPPRGRVLVVDDEELAVECIAEFLTARGFEVVTATTPEQALEMARDRRVDLLISDLRLPGLPGASLLARLRMADKDLPAILMTGGPLPADPIAAGTIVMRKPLALDELRRHSEQFLSERLPACPA